MLANANLLEISGFEHKLRKNSVTLGIKRCVHMPLPAGASHNFGVAHPRDQALVTALVSSMQTQAQAIRDARANLEA